MILLVSKYDAIIISNVEHINKYDFGCFSDSSSQLVLISEGIRPMKYSTNKIKKLINEHFPIEIFSAKNIFS